MWRFVIKVVWWLRKSVVWLLIRQRSVTRPRKLAFCFSRHDDPKCDSGISIGSKEIPLTNYQTCTEFRIFRYSFDTFPNFVGDIVSSNPCVGPGFDPTSSELFSLILSFILQVVSIIEHVILYSHDPFFLHVSDFSADVLRRWFIASYVLESSSFVIE